MSTFINMLLWTSITEILLFCGTFLTFCAAPLRTGVMFLLVFHLPRGVFGGILAFKLPRSHDVIEMLEVAAQDVHSLQTFEDFMKFKLSVNMIFSAKENSKWLRLYSLATLVCFLVDSMTFVIVYKWFIDSNYDHTNVWLMAVFATMLMLDTLYVWYLISLQRVMPKSFTKWIGESICGDSAKLHKELSNQLTAAQADELDTAIGKLEADLEEERDRKLRAAAEKKQAKQDKKGAPASGDSKKKDKKEPKK